MNQPAERCLVNSTLDIISGKWKMMILFQLMPESTLRFNELKKRIPGITQRVLTKQLRELEQEDIIERRIYPEIPPRVEYSVTEYGRTLQPILTLLHEWGEAHLTRKERRDSVEPELT
ncbi:winged helix-turn-helix transcriptional regulator [Alicyclobacillus fastidiosus]|uniref:Helix-turn-helix domain-containing protein n=1 Tax=Alicyclobacillus fastidiosus TaxID=392011 RepID=A0ABV5ADD9_9BACL|nr:helix-turn-helix domain-containing protein [Alicyclobacillus fastidiosus]WEH08781.1 helix-turn-helix domain-containing protein [Alicyclobacillus fastidiosus]